WWITAFVPLTVIFGIYFACDLWLWAFGRARTLSWASLTRGFEPFENLYAQLKGEAKGQERGAAALVIMPLMVLALPAGLIGALIQHGTRPLVAASLAIPSGVAMFLVMGFVGDVLKGSRAAFLAVSGALVGL